MPDGFLKVISGPLEGRNISLPTSATLQIGRRTGEVILNDPMVSGLHAEIVPRDQGWIIRDCGSTNGTLVDGSEIQEYTLHPACEIVIGATKMVLFVGPEISTNGPSPSASRDEAAWLLDEELVAAPDNKNITLTNADVIDQALRYPPGLNATIKVIAGQDSGRSFRLNKGTLTIGRNAGEIAINDLEASRHHAIIELFGHEMVFVRDLNSTNGTYHNGSRVEMARLTSGDTIGIGRSVLSIEFNT